MKPYEKVEAVYQWLLDAKIYTARIAMDTLVEIYDKFGGAVIPDRVSLEMTLTQLKRA